MKQKFINFRVESELHLATKILAARKNITVCKFIQDLIIQELERNKVLEEEWIMSKKINNINTM